MFAAESTMVKLLLASELGLLKKFATVPVVMIYALIYGYDILEIIVIDLLKIIIIDKLF